MSGDFYRMPPPSVENQANYRPLTKEEMIVWNDCVNSSVYKTGLPFAAGIELWRVYKSKNAGFEITLSTPNFARSSARFAVNVLFGSLFYLPVCYQKLSEMIFRNTNTDFHEMDLEPRAKGRFITPVEDINLQSNVENNIEGSESTFSHLHMDFDRAYSPSTVEDIDKDEKKIPRPSEITYDELKRRNREGYRNTIINPSGSMRQEGLSPILDKRSSPSETPRRAVRRNKYGDEIEE